MIAPNLPSFLIDLIQNPPQAGSGVHNWLFTTSRNLHAHVPAQEIFTILQEACAQCGRYVPATEILAAIKNSERVAWSPRDGSMPYSVNVLPPSKRWPEISWPLVKSICEAGYDASQLFADSQENPATSTERIIEGLFPKDCLLCAAANQRQAITKHREDWRKELSDLQFIVPNPMSALTGLTKDGKPSSRCLGNTGPRRFLVVEFDRPEFGSDEQAAVLHYLRKGLPLALVVHSGGKSLQGWFWVQCLLDETLAKFMQAAVKLGADPATWNRCQLVRMPGGKRLHKQTGEPQGIQKTFYFNPSVVQS